MSFRIASTCFQTSPRRTRPLGLLVTATLLIALAATSSTAWATVSRHSTHSATTRSAGTTQTAPSGVPAYWINTSSGAVDSFGGAGFYGSASGLHLNKPIVGMTKTPDGRGYWLVAADGGIFSYGDAAFHGSTGSMKLNQPVVGMASTPDGQGYWLVAADGGIFAFGDAAFHGSTGSMKLNKPMVGMAPTANGGGYWLVASDGGIFAFGNAAFHGSTGAMRLSKPIVSMAPTPNGGGYWLVGSDGGIFAFGNAQFAGSMGGVVLASPVKGMAATPDGGGYWLVSADGTAFAFGDASYYGSASFRSANVVGIAEGPGTGYAPHDAGYPQGAYGSDISNWQCRDTLPSGHTVGIVQVTGWSFGAVNPCLASEATWAGSGLELYMFLSFGQQQTGPSACAGNLGCNYGFAASEHAFEQAKSAKIDTSVAWWLDVESGNGAWSSSATNNASVIKGAILGLQQEGLADVGIYSNRVEWASVTGGSGYSPYVPEWVAEWGTNQPPFSPAKYCSGYAFALGPTWIIQYTNGATTNGFDDDYAC